MSGVNTQLYFNQSAGNASDGTNNWIALNRIIDPLRRTEPDPRPDQG